MLLHEMSIALANQQAFQFNVGHVMEVVTKQGEKIQSIAESTVSVQRPNKLRVDRLGPAGGATVFYDGNTLSIYGKRDNLYATAKAPDNLDATIDFARDQLALDAPGADLLYSNPYAALTEDVVSGRYLGTEPVGNRMCHHLAFRGNETDWQLWIEAGPRPLPCRYVITSKHVIRSPEYALTLSNWNLAPEPSPEQFTFRPPPDAGKINFAAVKDIARNAAHTQTQTWR
ncbi:MAG TPA: DUF2092 domain-containing protein [Kofleriaceae bacterium]|nr:DUF2092 domain-containing protein [Kofleriaceae bacterium]